jgi:urease accessory protein
MTFAGHLHLRAAQRPHGRTVLATQSFRAPFHLSKPYWDPDAGVLLVQVVNPTAGILSGDRLESDVAVDPEAALHVTTPSASRVFQMRERGAECHQVFKVGKGGWLDVMPEPLVPHRGSRYRQVTTVEVDAGGMLFFVDQLMPGRVAHGEAWQWEQLCLDLSVRYAGSLVLRERLNQSGPELGELANLAGADSRACFANAILIGDSGGENSPWRQDLHALHRDGCWIGVSALRQGGWTIRLIARDNLQLRDRLRAVRRILANYFPKLRCDARKL